MGGEHMRARRLLFLAALAVLSASLAAPALAGTGHSLTLHLGDSFTVTGRTGSAPGTQARAVGRVVVSGRWGDGRWNVLTTTTTDREGYYRFTIRPHRRGSLALRIAPPDHRLRHYALRVI
jgi:hypothetical protein